MLSNSLSLSLSPHSTNEKYVYKSIATSIDVDGIRRRTFDITQSTPQLRQFLSAIASNRSMSSVVVVGVVPNA